MTTHPDPLVTDPPADLPPPARMRLEQVVFPTDYALSDHRVVLGRRLQFLGRHLPPRTR